MTTGNLSLLRREINEYADSASADVLAQARTKRKSLIKKAKKKGLPSDDAQVELDRISALVTTLQDGRDGATMAGVVSRMHEWHSKLLEKAPAQDRTTSLHTPPSLFLPSTRSRAFAGYGTGRGGRRG